MGSKEDNPHNMVGGQASSLEIFLFTNGQEDSPPRKHNVRVNDRWDTTLNFLARSQNGSNHTIELYTTEGKRIEKAQELASGAAYVAVQPPHAFLPAGYNDYLMRASRSREKRQEKISNSSSLIKPDKGNSKDKIAEDIMDTTNIKIIQDIIIRSSSRTAVQEQDNITNQVKSDNAKAVKPIRRISVKQPQKRNNSLSQQNPYTLRKNTNNLTPPVKRGYISSKIDTSKKKLEISSIQNTKNVRPFTEVDSIITKTNESKSKGDEAGGIMTLVSRTRDSETVETYHSQKNITTASVPDTGVTGYRHATNSTHASNNIERNILLPVLSEKEPLESTCIIPIKTNDKNTVFVPSQDIKSIPDILVYNSSPSRVSPQVDLHKCTKTAEKPAILTDTDNERFPKKTLIFGRQTNDNNFAIYVKQGNMVSLKLNVEVKNVSSTTFEANHDQLSSSSMENTPIKKFDVEATNIARTRNCCDAPTLTEPWQAGLPSEQLQQITDDLQVELCTCCSCFRTPESVAPVYVDNNNYFILLPSDELNKHLVSCTCNLEIDQTSKSEILDHKVFKLSKTEKQFIKLDGDSKLPRNSENSNKLKKSVLHEKKSIENELFSRNASSGEVNQCDCEVAPVDRASPCDCARELAFECSACGHEQGTSSGVVKQNPPANNKSTMLKETFTQTYWSGIVLEARPGEDGSYAFHIPSLKLLKNTNYLY